MTVEHPVLPHPLAHSVFQKMAYLTKTRSIGFYPPGASYALSVGGVNQNQSNGYAAYFQETSSENSGDRKTTNPFLSIRYPLVAGIANGQYRSNSALTNWVLPVTITAASSRPLAPSLAAASTELRARTNPSRPRVDVVQFIAELRDVPKMIFQIGDLLRRMTKASRSGKAFKPTEHDIASGYLGWTFGWDPLISDLRKLLDFEEIVRRKTIEIEKLRSGGLRRKIPLYKEHWTTTTTQTCGPSTSNPTRVLYRIENEFEMWGTIRWKPTSDSPVLLRDDVRDLAREIAFGQSLDLSTVWELMPWSWLIDWFTTTGDYFAANRNQLKLQVDDIAIMTFSSARRLYAGFDNNPYGCTFVPVPEVLATRKARAKGTAAVVTASSPLLDLKQWSILSALAVTRLTKRRG